jgi:hypothetical protein
MPESNKPDDAVLFDLLSVWRLTGAPPGLGPGLAARITAVSDYVR